MVTVGDTFMISTNFSWLPHSGISLSIDDSLSGDADMRCTANGVQNKFVNHICTAKRPSIKSVKAQLSFCDIEFFSSTINITIKEQPGEAICTVYWINVL